MELQPDENICHMGRRVDYQGSRHLSPSRVSDVNRAIEDAFTPAGNQAWASDMAGRVHRNPAASLASQLRNSRRKPWSR